MKVGNKAKIQNRYNQIPHPTENTMWESDKNTRKYITQESQEVSHVRNEPKSNFIARINSKSTI